LVDIEVDFGVAVHGDDADLASGGFDEPRQGGEVEVLAAFELGEVALLDAECFGELFLGKPMARRTSLRVARIGWRGEAEPARRDAVIVCYRRA
jgi:hypothetical protein